MAGPTPREVFLALCSGARLCLPKGLEGQSRGPLVWQHARDHPQTAGDRIVNSQVNSDPSRSGFPNIYELLTQSPI